LILYSIIQFLRQPNQIEIVPTFMTHVENRKLSKTCTHNHQNVGQMLRATDYSAYQQDAGINGHLSQKGMRNEKKLFFFPFPIPAAQL